MSMALHILVGHHYVICCQLVFIYMRTPPTHYYLEFGGQAEEEELRFPEEARVNRVYVHSTF
jgi:hypothetical protein